MKNAKNLISILLTVLIASGVIIGGAYALKSQTEKTGPGQTVLNFYEDWVGYEGNPLINKYYQDHPLLTKNFSEKIDQIVSSFDRNAYDPILCAQDKPESIKVTNLKEKEEEAVLTLEEKFYNNKQNLEILLEKTDNSWQIKDIICPQTNSNRLNFTEEGNLVKEGEGWKLLYEEPGSPALRVNLKLTPDSACLINQTPHNCSPDSWEVGERVGVKGEKSGNILKINSLEFLN